MRKSKYFKIEELVPPECIEKYGEEGAWGLLDADAVQTLDEVREIMGVPLVCNDWNVGGGVKYRGYRTADCGVGAERSQHKLGRAFDVTSKLMTAPKMREMLEQNKDRLTHKIRVERGCWWLHFDMNNKSYEKKILYFYA